MSPKFRKSKSPQYPPGMSTNRNSVLNGGPTTAYVRKRYFCHQCEGIVTIMLIPSQFDDVACPTCGGGFIEEYENPNPNPNPRIRQSPSGSSFSFSFSTSPNADFPLDEPTFPNPADLMAAVFGGAPAVGRSMDVDMDMDVDEDRFNPIAFLRSHLNSMRANGAEVQFVFDNVGGGGVGGGGGFGLPGNIGDYFVGPGFEQLIQQLAENDPNRYGTPPASKEAVEKLPDIKITEELMASDNEHCAVCMDAFELGANAKQMPCKHIFHKDCILPWLELHNSCPVCRYELPTDDAEYEQRNRGGGSGDSSEDNSQARRFRVQLPWPLSSFGFGSDGSNSGGRQNNNSGGESHR